MEKKSQLPWYKRKKFYLPVAVALGVIGFLPSLVSLSGSRSMMSSILITILIRMNQCLRKSKTDCCDAVCRFLTNKKEQSLAVVFAPFFKRDSADLRTLTG